RAGTGVLRRLRPHHENAAHFRVDQSTLCSARLCLRLFRLEFRRWLRLHRTGKADCEGDPWLSRERGPLSEQAPGAKRGKRNGVLPMGQRAPEARRIKKKGMNQLRRVSGVVTAHRQTEGGGFVVRRPFPT